MSWFRSSSRDKAVLAAVIIVVAVIVVALVAGCSRRRVERERQESSVASAGSASFGPCRDGSEWRQRHGTSCLCCHAEFGIAGSVAHDAGVALVRITDARGHELEMAPNPFDNFFRHAKMEPPLRAQLVFDDGEVRTMSEPVRHGSCNACHGEAERLLGDR